MHKSCKAMKTVHRQKTAMSISCIKTKFSKCMLNFKFSFMFFSSLACFTRYVCKVRLLGGVEWWSEVKSVCTRASVPEYCIS